MTALSKFLDRHGIDAKKVATAAAAALIAVMSVAAPAPAAADMMPTVTITSQNVDLIQKSSERVDDQMRDMQQTAAAITEIAGRMTATKKVKFQAANEAEAKFLADSPNQDIANTDGMLLKLAAELPEDSQTAALVEHINWQKTQLLQAHRYLDAMKDSFVNGTKADREMSRKMLEDTIENYNSQWIEISFDGKTTSRADGLQVDLGAIAQEIDSAPAYK